jgi:cell division septation protein DedD
MSSMETINDEIQPNPETSADSAKKQAKRVFIGFAATITIGLVIAGWYVGGRIFAAEKVHAATAIAKPVSEAPAPVPAPAIAKTVEAAPVAEPVAVAVEKSKSEEAKPETTPAPGAPSAAAPTWNTVEPQSGDLYLQLATMGPNSTNEYLQVLDAKGIHPKIAPGPSDNLHRLVIGPYPDKAALEKQQQELESAGIEFMARRY